MRHLQTNCIYYIRYTHVFCVHISIASVSQKCIENARMPQKLKPEFVEEFGRCLASVGSQPPNVIFQACMVCMNKHKLLYRMKLHPKLFLTHIENRSKLTQSPLNVHRTCLKIHKAAADLKQLINAACMELASSGQQRDINLEAKERLISRRYLS